MNKDAVAIGMILKYVGMAFGIGLLGKRLHLDADERIVAVICLISFVVGKFILEAMNQKIDD